MGAAARIRAPRPPRRRSREPARSEARAPARLTPREGTAIARPMISVGEALTRVCAVAPVLGPERVPLAAALGRVAAEDVVATREVPGAPNSAMDGFAVRHAD